MNVDVSGLSYGDNTITLDISDGKDYTVNNSVTVTVRVTTD